MSDTKTFLVSFICGVSCIWDHSCIRVTCFDDMPTWSVSNICLTHMRYNWFGVNYMHESWCTYIGLCSHAYVSVWITIDVVSTICTSHGAHINETCVTHHELTHSQFIWSVTQLMTQLRIVSDTTPYRLIPRRHVWNVWCAELRDLVTYSDVLS